MKSFDVLYKKNLSLIELDAPVLLQKTTIVKDSVKEKILLKNTFVNVSTESVVAIAIKGGLSDIFGNPIKYNQKDTLEYIYMDIIFEPNTLFGKNVVIELPANARKATIRIDKIVLQNGTVWNSNPDNIVTVQSQQKIEISGNFIDSIDNNPIKPVFYAVENSSCWQCTCGQVNKASDEYCRNCKRTKVSVISSFNKEIIEQQYKIFLHNQKENSIKKSPKEELHNTNDNGIMNETQSSPVVSIVKQPKNMNAKNKAILCGICSITVILMIICIKTFPSKQASEITQQNPVTTKSVDSEQDLIRQTRNSIEPYVAIIGEVTENQSVSVTEGFYNNMDKVKIMGKKGTVSHGFMDSSGDTVAMMDWNSNEPMSTKEYDEFVKSLDDYFDEVAEEQHYDNISDGTCFVWNDLDNQCWVIGWYEKDKAYLRWYGKDFWHH